MIHNWFGFENICMTHTHHVGNDFELFVVASFFVIFIYSQPKKGIFVLTAVGIVSTVARFYVTYFNDITVYVSFKTKFVDFEAFKGKFCSVISFAVSLNFMRLLI